MAGTPEVWTDAAAYERYVGRWSRLVAVEFLNWLAVPKGAAWLDVGCGTGALSETILRMSEPARVEGIDPAPAYVGHVRARVVDTRVRFDVGNTQRLFQSDESFNAVVSGLVLNFVPRPELALAEMVRVVRKGGVVACYVWDYAGRMELMRHFWDAAIALDPAASESDEGRRFPICRADRLETLFAGAGLQAVESRSIEVPTRFDDFEDYWSPFLGGQGPAPSYAMSLSEDDRGILRDRIRASLPLQADGSIDLVARAWAVRGRREAL